MVRGRGANPRRRKKWRIEEWRGLWRPIVLNCSIWQFLLHGSRKLVLHSSDSLKFSFFGPLIATNQNVRVPNPVCECVLFDLHSVFKTKQVESLADSKCADGVSESSFSWKVIPGVPLEQLPLDRTLPSLLLSSALGPASLHFYWEIFEI